MFYDFVVYITSLNRTCFNNFVSQMPITLRQVSRALSPRDAADCCFAASVPAGRDRAHPTEEASVLHS